MDEQNTGFILCDISFNGQIIGDVKLPRACSMSNIVQGLWLDDCFRKTGLEYLKAKDEALKTNDDKNAPGSQPFGGIDRSILRAYVAIRIMPAWKWLEFKDFIVDFENKKDCYTVGDVLGTLCTGLHKPVLRIVPKNENESDDQEVRSIVKELLKTKTVASLAAAECPLSNGMLTLIAQGRYMSNIGRDKCQAFLQWMRQQDIKNSNTSGNNVLCKAITQPKLASSTANPNDQQGKGLKPRITFSQNELDNLSEWFNEDERPSKEVMLHYTEMLNIPRQAASMRLLAPDSIFFWFKNRRAKKKRQDISVIQPWEEKNVAMGMAENGSLTISMANSEHVEEDQSDITSVVSQQNVIGGEPPAKSRKVTKVRVSFDPQTELTILSQWFEDDERPNKDIMMEYTNILNEARAMNNKQELTFDSVAMWFKNRRAKKRRTEGHCQFSYSSENGEQMEVQALEHKNEDEAIEINVTSEQESINKVPLNTKSQVVCVSNIDYNVNKERNSKDNTPERNVYNAGLVSVVPVATAM